MMIASMSRAEHSSSPHPAPPPHAGYEKRAVFPQKEVQYRIAQCIHELQVEERRVRLKDLQETYKGRPCIGLQLDMWTGVFPPSPT